MNEIKNVLGGALIACSLSPMTGFYRDGCCQTGPEDRGTHTVCAQMTEEFLSYTKANGNDLSTPIPEYDFPGLEAGDFWCLCVLRWEEAMQAGKAPKINLKATHENTLDYVGLEVLKKYALEDAH